MRSIPILALALLAACQSAADHQKDVHSSGDTLTVGTVQKNIKIGMSGADVATVLGSPNIVTTDDQRRETWVYDRIATDSAYSTSEGGLFLILAGASSKSGASSTTQRTLTVIVKFDESGKVRDYAYNSSKF